MKLLLHLVRPQYLIPIHGELRMLKQHAKLAEEVGIEKDKIIVVENGQIIEFINGEVHLGDRVPGGYIFVDGSGVGDVDSSIVRERETLGQDGIMVVNLNVNRDSGKLKGKPEILTRGFMLPEELDPSMDELEKQIHKALKNPGKDIEKTVMQALKSYFYQETKRSPFIFVTVNRC